MAWLREYKFGEIADDIRGVTVYGVDDEKLGTVADGIVDRDSGELRYLVVDAGWLSTRQFIIPVDQTFARGQGDDLFVSLTKTEVKHLPEFNPEQVRSDQGFAQYEKSYHQNWRAATTREVRPSARLERFRESLRARFNDSKRRVEPKSTEARETPAMVTGARGATGVYGMYKEQPEVERAISELKDAGFRNTDISVLFPDKDTSRRFALEHNTKAPEGALAGGGTGLVVGGALGWLAGIGALAIPGAGPFIAAGPIVSAIAGAGVGSAIGGIAGALIGLGMPEFEAKQYEAEVKKGRMLVSVHCADVRFADSARKVLERTGAKDVFVTEEKRAA